MTTFLFTLLYIWNLYVSIKEKFHGSSGGWTMMVGEIFIVIFVSNVARRLTLPSACAPPSFCLSVCLGF